MTNGLKKFEQPRSSVFHADRPQLLELQHHNQQLRWAMRREWLREHGSCLLAPLDYDDPAMPTLLRKLYSRLPTELLLNCIRIELSVHS